jgi:hypothetical protein
MKNSNLSLDQMKEWKRQIDSGVSSPLFTDPKTQKTYTAKSVTEYVNGFYTDLASNNNNILKSGNEPIVGVRSIKGNTLPAGVNQLVYEACLTSGTAGAATNDGLIATDFDEIAPAFLRNGEVTVHQGTQVLRTTGDELNNGYASTGNADNFKAFVPFSLRETMPFGITITPAGTPVALKAYSFKYRAIEFVLADKAS